MQDLKHALRQLLKSRGFTAVAVLTLGLGIGINVAVFSKADALLWRPLPFPKAKALVRGSEIFLFGELTLKTEIEPSHVCCYEL